MFAPPHTLVLGPCYFWRPHPRFLPSREICTSAAIHRTECATVTLPCDGLRMMRGECINSVPQEARAMGQEWRTVVPVSAIINPRLPRRGPRCEHFAAEDQTAASMDLPDVLCV
jgi:hypothetical protein